MGVENKDVISKDLEALLSHEGLQEEVKKLAGEASLSVLKLLPKVDDDEKIAKKLNVKVSDVRAVLNKLNQEGIVYYDRTKDADTGWFYYTWVIEPIRLKDWYSKKLEAHKNYLYSLVMYDDHYYCSKCGIYRAYKFDVAMDYDFSCPIHQKPLHIIDEATIRKYDINSELPQSLQSAALPSMRRKRYLKKKLKTKKAAKKTTKPKRTSTTTKTTTKKKTTKKTSAKKTTKKAATKKKPAKKKAVKKTTTKKKPAKKAATKKKPAKKTAAKKRPTTKKTAKKTKAKKKPVKKKAVKKPTTKKKVPKKKPAKKTASKKKLAKKKATTKKRRK